MLSKPKVLIIDDERGFTDMLKLLLEASDEYSVSVINQSIDVVPLILTIQPDIILLDVIMPEREGPDVAVEIQETKGLENIPIIFLTATVTAEEVASGGGFIGGHRFISKPSPVTTLTNSIDMALLQA